MAFFTKYYWRLGFKTKLYDLLTPEAYHQSLRRAVACVPEGKGQILLDAGCGSGQLIGFLERVFASDGRFLGTDLLMAGLVQARDKAKEKHLEERAFFFQSDLCQPSPLAQKSVDVIIAHFSVYTLGDSQNRKNALRNLSTLLRPGGRMILVNPSPGYDSREIIKESLSLVEEKSGKFSSCIKKWLVYPLTRNLGLKFIEDQLRSGRWHGYTIEELREEVETAGLVVESVENVYGHGAYLVQASRPLEKI